MNSQAQAAERFRELHQAGAPLILPNIWEPFGARLLQAAGYPAVATASEAVAISQLQDDGERVSVDSVLEGVRAIAAAVSIPLSVDFERGYAADTAGLSANIRRLIAAGAVGLNLEDGLAGSASLRPIAEQCERIAAVRAAGAAAGVRLVINARTDVFLPKIVAAPAERVRQAIERAAAYFEAGADCFYPLLAGDPEVLTQLRAGIAGPINVYLRPGLPPVAELQRLGINRLSVGPAVLRAVARTILEVGNELRTAGTYNSLFAGSPDGLALRQMLGLA